MAVATIARRLGGTVAVLRQIPGQRRAYAVPRSRLLEWRDARVREVVRYAARTVPYYGEVFGEDGLDPRSLRGADDLERLPLLEKHIVREDPSRFCSDSDAGREALEIRGTGTTGMPLPVFHDRGSLLANIAYAERERAVERQFVGRRYRYRILDLRGRGSVFGRVQDFYAEALFRPLRPKRRLVTLDAQEEEVLATIERTRPAVVRGFASTLELIFHAAAARGRLSHRPATVVYAGDVMSAGGRRLIEEQFGIPVLSVYGSVECFKIGFTCERRSGFHLHEDLVHVRLVDRDGRSVAPGERGEVVVSNLVNRGTVLLNYRLGDAARLCDEPCPCGRTSHRLVELDGRVEDIVELADGTSVHPAELRSPFRLREGIVQFQLVQRDRERFELRVVARETAEAERALADAVSDLRAVLHGARIDVVRAADLTPGPGQKFRAIVALGTPAAPEPERRGTERD